MHQFSLNKFISATLVILVITSFFFGFYLDESSFGAAGYDGDFEHIYTNLEFFLKNDLATSLSNPEYHDSRPPTTYILHELLNPFTESKINFRRSVFFISLSVPILFYFCLKQKFNDKENLLLILLSSTIFLSPYFRTSSFWGLQENYGLIFLLLTFLSMRFLNEENGYSEKKHIKYIKFLTITFLSSACIYFDQKLIIIPAICFFTIISSKQLIKFKIFSTFCYFVFSLPYIYLITIWGSLIPSNPTAGRNFLEVLYFDHLGYATTMIAFYLLPLLFFKGEKIILLIKSFFKDNKNYFLIVFFVLYLIFLLIFSNSNEESILGGGFIHKISILMFKNHLYQSIFIYFSFFISWLIILIYFNKKTKDYFILFYLLFLPIFIWPLFQEYFDPLIIILAFTFFSSKVYINYKNSIILFVYLSFFLVSSNVYYLVWVK